MKAVDPPEYFVVRECDSPGMREIYAPGGRHRYAFKNETLADVAFQYVPRHQWRPGEWRSAMRGWRTREGAERFMAGGRAKWGGYRTYIVQWFEDGEGDDEHDVLAECGASDTGCNRNTTIQTPAPPIAPTKSGASAAPAVGMELAVPPAMVKKTKYTDEQRAAWARADQLAASLGGEAVHYTDYRSGRVELTLDQAEALLARLNSDLGAGSVSS